MLDKLFVIDDKVPLIFRQELYAGLLNACWGQHGVSVHPLEPTRTWSFIVKNFNQNPEEDPNAHLHKSLDALWRHHIGPMVAEKFGYDPKQIGLHHVYGNCVTWGDVSPIHRDAEPTEKNKLTALFYPNLEWLPDWAAETVFFNEDKTDIICSIHPKPGRLVIFDAHYYHAMRQPTRDAPISRLSLAYKIEILENQS